MIEHGCPPLLRGAPAMGANPDLITPAPSPEPCPDEQLPSALLSVLQDIISLRSTHSEASMWVHQSEVMCRQGCPVLPDPPTLALPWVSLSCLLLALVGVPQNWLMWHEMAQQGPGTAILPLPATAPMLPKRVPPVPYLAILSGPEKC